jgi:ribonucrease Y
MILYISLGMLLGLGAGALGGYHWRKQTAQAQANSIEALAEKRLMEAKNKESEILLQAKEKALKVIEDAKKEEADRHNDLKNHLQRLEQRETLFDQKLMEFEDRKTKLQQKVDDIQKIREKVDTMHAEAGKKLETISGYTKETAMAEYVKRFEAESQEELLSRRLKLDKDGSETLEARASEIVINAIERIAANHASETTSTAVHIPSDDMKGRIIGKDGRNIKTIERLTGCELVIDETPDMILVSSFSPIRRRVCSLALEKLIKDGRIQPAKIEEMIEEAKRELAVDIKKAGEETLHKLGIVGLDPKLVSIVGRLKYRTSYGQNILNHSTEVALLCGIMAEELGLDVGKAKRAGFFHDIGKAVDHETQGTHTQIGYTILKKFNMDEDVAQAALTHHDPNPPLLLTKLVIAADAISASRTGARRDTYEQYVSRLEDLEKTAGSFPGIEKVYAIQAGREVRVFVNHSQVDDYQAYNLAKDIARKIEGELQYPGEIKVNVIRETRVIEYAR